MNRRYITCLSIATLVHGAGLFLFQFQKEMQKRSARQIYGIEYREEVEKKKAEKKKAEEKKEEKKPITPEEPTVSVKDKLKDLFAKEEKLEQKISEEDLRKLAQIARPLEMAKPEEMIDISKMIDIHKTQAMVDVDQYEKLNIGEAGEIEVLRIGGTQKSTREILQEDRIVLPKAATLGKKVGLFTTPGVALPGEGGGIQLERAKASDIRKEGESFKRAFSESKKGTLLEETKPSKEQKPKTEVVISGALKDRKILESPIPLYPDWALKRGIAAFLQFQLNVGPDGKVTGMVLVMHTTGYPEWDSEVINWLKKYWKWQELPIGTSGYISFRFIIG